jgi:hypothetical protein
VTRPAGYLNLLWGLSAARELHSRDRPRLGSQLCAAARRPHWQIADVSIWGEGICARVLYSYVRGLICCYYIRR